MTNPSSKIINTKYIGIELTQNKIAVIDSDQYHKIQHIKNWYAYSADDINFYAQSRVNGETVSLHNLIMDYIPSESNSEQTVDHKNRKTLDDRNINLRIVPQSYQIINQGLRTTNESGFRGVSCHRGYWIASWVENNENKSQLFSIKQYGEERAFEKAVEYRLLKELFIPEYAEALCLNEKLDYFDFENIYDNPDVTIIYKDGLRSDNTSGKENFREIKEPNKPTKYIVTYYNEYGKRTQMTFHEKDEETKPIYNEAIDFQNMAKKNPKLALTLLKNKKSLRSDNTSGEENIKFIIKLNKPTKYLIRYFNEFGKRKMLTFNETNEETKPVYKEMIDFQMKMLINHPKTKREDQKKLLNKKELHKKLLNKKKSNNKNVKTK